MRRLSFLPRSLYGRAALILIVPIVTIQLIVSIAFIQRHFEGVTRQLSQGVIAEIGVIRHELESGQGHDPDWEQATAMAGAFGMELREATETAAVQDREDWDDLTGDIVINSLRGGIEGVIVVDLTSVRGSVVVALQGGLAPFELVIPRTRLSAPNPHQLLVIMVLASVLMTLFSYAFLRNQLRPIARLAAAADAFGKGEVVRYRPRGATEVRAAGAAFLDMRSKIEKAIETRTMMLSGISHDLRTPLTRLRLGLSMLPEDEEVEALLSDVAEMERMVDEFLAFARGDAMEEAQDCDPLGLVHKVVENALRAGQKVVLAEVAGPVLPMRLRPQAVTRALENLLGNALRHGDSAMVSIVQTERQLRLVVEDNGPGIPEEQRETAMSPFARLDDARNRNAGNGAGLGLAIVADIARSHGGRLLLGKSEVLGGLKAELRLAR